MRTFVFATLSALLVAPLATAQVGDWGAVAGQLMANPAVQQAAVQAASNPAVQQAVLQQALAGSANPVPTATGKGALATALATLTPQQTALLTQKAQGIASKLFTAKEQTALSAFQASPEGSSIMGKMPLLMEQLAPVILQMYASTSGKATVKTK